MARILKGLASDSGTVEARVARPRPGVRRSAPREVARGCSRPGSGRTSTRWPRRLAAGGRVVSAFNVRCIRSCAAVLLRAARSDSLVNDPKLHPPNVQFTEAMDARRREGCSVVTPDGTG